MDQSYRWGCYFTIGEDRNHADKFIGVVSDGSPQLGHKPVIILEVRRFDSIEAARQWFREAKKTEPWIARQ